MPDDWYRKGKRTPIIQTAMTLQIYIGTTHKAGALKRKSALRSVVSARARPIMTAAMLVNSRGHLWITGLIWITGLMSFPNVPGHSISVTNTTNTTTGFSV